MTESQTREILEALRANRNTFGVEALAAVRRLFPNRTVIALCDRFDLDEFADDRGNSCIWDDADVLEVWASHDGAGGIIYEQRIAMAKLTWNGRPIEVLSLPTTGEICDQSHSYVLAASQEEGDGFLKDYYAWQSKLKHEVWVFDSGYWRRSRGLWESIQSSTLDNLVLEDEFKEEILNDFQSFFRSKDVYRKYNVPWKRGVLLFGDPGNGKTHMLKALVNKLGVHALYVRSFRTDHGTEEQCIARAFSFARLHPSCILVLEDLDSLITDKNRSYFLNELDGFAANDGMFVVATSNHPERLDQAIINRPSRFDRKYLFKPPTPELRAKFLEAKQADVEPGMRLSEAGMERVVGLTEGFSFAYLKELWMSSLLGWVNLGGQPGSMDEVAEKTALLLKDQIAAYSPGEPALSPDDDDYDLDEDI